LGPNILGSGWDFDIEIRLGAGAFVCGEETALIKSVEGERGMPVPRPPFPANEGLWGKPTIVNNVESLNDTAYIMANGGAEFAARGTQGDGTKANPGSRGTKVFALTGKVRNSGLVEVPLGTTLREIIFDIGGGIKGDKKFKGVQIGGPSGGILNEADLDVPIDYESLKAHGSMMGSGGMIVMDEDDCVVDVARFYMEFCVDESCGKCSPCRIGTTQMLNILNKITSGNGEMADLNKLETIAQAMNKAALCALGQTAPNPVLSTLNKFRDEWVEHIKEKKCRAGKCRNLLRYSIDEDKCIGCGMCAKGCPASCIAQSAAQLGPDKAKAGKKKAPYKIDQAKCIKCGACMAACKFGAVVRA
jgi:NADH-quinone oxidoreductase subunit F/NADP-reducing hydrogenase subunit HndC